MRRAPKSRHRAGDAVPPGVVQFGEWGGKFAAGGFHRQCVATDLSDLRGGHAHEFGAFHDFYSVQRFATDDDARLRFAEEQRVEAVGRGS